MKDTAFIEIAFFQLIRAAWYEVVGAFFIRSFMM